MTRPAASGAKARTRTGLTTGSCATAAAKAACLLLAGLMPGEAMDIPTPDGSARLLVPLQDCGPGPEGSAVAGVLKDGGDDPDVTHGARVEVRLRALAPFVPARAGEGGPLSVVFQAGEGVGVVTRPGLAVAVGQPAINPGPRRQMELALAEALARAGVYCPSLELTVSVPGGRDLARKTLNPRLGIEGGLSILGSGGTVKAYSAAAWTATIDASLDVARAAGLGRVLLTTGRRSEAAARALWPDLPEQAVAAMGDFFAHALSGAAGRGFGQVDVVCFLGKALKMAQGLANTHARHADQDFTLLAALARECGAAPADAARLADCRTVREAFELLGWPGPSGPWQGVARALGHKALDQARAVTGPGPGLGLVLLDFPGAPGDTARPVCLLALPGAS